MSKNTPVTRARHSGFTLVEMMVSMTLTLFVMVILSQCFVQALETFSGLKAIGDMQEELRTAATLLRADLGFDHFEGKRRLSDPLASFIPASGGTKIREGFFVLGQGYPNQPSTKNQQSEGVTDGIESHFVYDHWLHFSAKMRGNARERFFSATSKPPLNATATDSVGLISGDLRRSANAVFVDEPPNPNSTIFNSAWAEIAYALVPTGTVSNPAGPPPASQPTLISPRRLYALYRWQYVVIPDTSKVRISGLIPNSYPNIASSFERGIFFNPNDLAQGRTTRTFNPYTFFPPPPRDNSRFPAATLVLSNVVSFEVNALTDPSLPFVLANINHQPSRVPYPKFDDIPPGHPFDTAEYATSMPTAPRYVINGLQIIIRIWDPKSRQTRQITVLQDM